MKKLIYSIFFFMTLSASAQNVGTILDRAITAFDNSNGMKASFAMQIQYAQQNGMESFEGVMDMKGNRFAFQTPDLQMWFDGVTQWSYVLPSGEVNVSNPSEKELQSTNPSIILRNYKKQFNAEYKGESTTKNGKSAYDVVLIPKEKSDITRIELQIEKNTYMQSAIKVTAKDGTTFAIRFNDIKTNVNQPDDLFAFKESNYPNVEVIDLR